MVQNDNKILGMLGLAVTGDCGPWTFYTSARKQLVFYARMPSLNPPSPLQSFFRDRWRAAALAWKTLPAAERKNWEAAAKGASCRVTGYNLWVYLYCTGDERSIATIEQQSGIGLLA